MFFHRLGPVLARCMPLTGDIIEAGEIEHPGSSPTPARHGGARPLLGREGREDAPPIWVVIAKEAFRLVEQSQVSTRARR